MNAGPRHPSGGGGKNSRRRGRRPPNQAAVKQAATASSIAAFTPRPWITATARRSTANNGRGGRPRPGFAPAYNPVEPDPLPEQREDAASRIFAFVDDLFFQAKIQETARKLNVKVEFSRPRKN